MITHYDLERTLAGRDVSQPEPRMAFNLNQCVWVRLTPEGQRMAAGQMVSEPDERGYVRMQFHAFLAAFSDVLLQGPSMDLPFEPTVEFEARHITPV